MADVIAIRIEDELLKKLAQLGNEIESDRSSLLRLLIMKGYKEMLKEKAAQLYIEGKITFSEAAYRADLTLWDMEMYLVEKGYKSDYSIDDLEEEMKLLNKK